MRAPLALPLLAIVLSASSLVAQPVPKVQPNLPPPNVLKDTVIISSLALANGATFASGPLTLNHVLVGFLKPTQYRASKFADFRDATWKTYSAVVPLFSGPQSGPCSSPSSLRMIAHFQVRAPKPNVPKSFVHSNIARDTTCLMISG